jgi:adenylate cyclase
VPHAQYRDAVERELERRILISEQQRSAILAGILVAVFVARALYHAAYGLHGDELPGRGATLVVLGCWVGLEAVTYLFVSQRIRDGRERVPFRSYVSTTLEVAMPTAMMALMCQYDRPLNVLTSSINYTYFLIIILSPLRLDARLCVFTGALAAAAYGLLVVVYAEALAEQYVGTAALMHLTFLMRTLFLLTGGLAAGYVCHRVRATLIETLSEIRKRADVVALFGQHVSPTVVDQLLTRPTGDHSELRDVCVMVLDIRNFTTYSEDRAADEVVRYLNTLWSFMVRTVNEHHGFVNKFLGDGFLAVFGAPLASDNPCVDALGAAQRIMQELEARAEDGSLPPTQIGIALHAGQVIVGNIGSAERKEYTVIGDVVNVAFRIEALNKEFGSQLLISEPVRRLTGVEAERIAPIAIRGRHDAVELFRVA